MEPREILGWVWLGVVALTAMNGFSAGVAASLHAWKSRMPRAGRVLTAAVTTGLLPCGILILLLLDPADVRPGGTELLAISGISFGVGAIGSLPGAWLITRKLARPGDEFRAFE